MSRNQRNPLAIVMGRNYTTRLTLVRAAGLVGCDVVVIRTSVGSMFFKPVDEKSKYVVEVITIKEDESVLIEKINGFRNVSEKVILLPADDFTAGTIDLHLDELEKHFLMPHVNHVQGAVFHLMDKKCQKELAQQVGFGVAEGWLSVFVDGKHQIPDGVCFPCFVKPNESFKGHWKNLMKRCDDVEELKIALSAYSSVYQSPVLIEEFHEISEEYGVQGISLNDCAYFPSIVRKKDCREGLTATGNLGPIDKYPEVRDKLAKFLKLTHFTGVFDIDMYYSGDKWYFNELNVRLGANGFALTYGVANIPGIFVDYMLKGQSKEYDVPRDFKTISFASENVLRNMYFDRMISHKQYKQYLNSVDLLSIPFRDDDEPWKEFKKTEWFLPLYRCFKSFKKVLYYDMIAFVKNVRNYR